VNDNLHEHDQHNVVNNKSHSDVMFWMGNVVKRRICYETVCPSVCLSVTLASNAYKIQDMEIFALFIP